MCVEYLTAIGLKQQSLEDPGEARGDDGIHFPELAHGEDIVAQRRIIIAASVS